jgi:hypothetical protein
MIFNDNKNAINEKKIILAFNSAIHIIMYNSANIAISTLK